MNIDPLGEMTPVVSPYAYVLNNPLLFTDPDGMRVVAKDEDAQELITNSLTELLGENHGFYFNKKGVLKHKGGKDHRKAKREFSDEQKAIFDGFTEIASNTDYTIDVFKQNGNDKEFSAEFETQVISKDENNLFLYDSKGNPIMEKSGSITVDFTSEKEGNTGGGVLLTRKHSDNAVAIIFPDILKDKSFKAAGGKFTIPSISSGVIHELLDHGVDFVRNGNVDKTKTTSIQNVDYQNKAFIIIGSPTRLNHTHR
jgi:hypothetical protein